MFYLGLQIYAICKICQKFFTANSADKITDIANVILHYTYYTAEAVISMSIISKILLVENFILSQNIQTSLRRSFGRNSQILDDFSPCREYRAGTIMRTLSDSQKYRKNNTDRDGHNNGRLAGFLRHIFRGICIQSGINTRLCRQRSLHRLIHQCITPRTGVISTYKPHRLRLQ